MTAASATLVALLGSMRAGDTINGDWLESAQKAAALSESEMAVLEDQIARSREFDRVAYPNHERITMDTSAAPAAQISSRFPDIDIAEGEIYAGLSRDPDTGAWHHLVLLPAKTDKDLKWQEAIDWAKSVGGELPTRFESALLYANVRDQIDQDYWYWTATEVASEPSWAWGQGFYDGIQDYGRKDYRGRARAVRRVPV